MSPAPIRREWNSSCAKSVVTYRTELDLCNFLLETNTVYIHHCWVASQSHPWTLGLLPFQNKDHSPSLYSAGTDREVLFSVAIFLLRSFIIGVILALVYCCRNSNLSFSLGKSASASLHTFIPLQLGIYISRSGTL